MKNDGDNGQTHLDRWIAYSSTKFWWIFRYFLSNWTYASNRDSESFGNILLFLFWYYKSVHNIKFLRKSQRCLSCISSPRETRSLFFEFRWFELLLFWFVIPSSHSSCYILNSLWPKFFIIILFRADKCLRTSDESLSNFCDLFCILS